jgi:hypothetical protein
MSARCHGIAGLLIVTLLASSCTAFRPSKKGEGEEAESLPRGGSARKRELLLAREALAKARQENEELSRRLAQQTTATVRAQEARASLEVELEKALEELLRSKASIRGIESRALATSRIAEVRVRLESLSESDDPEVVQRLQRAGELLQQADLALAEGNFSGAVYLADRAGELMQEARMVGLIRESSSLESSDIVAVVPSRRLVVVKSANLRQHPGIQSALLDTVKPGEELTAIARAGTWYQVRLENDASAWIHSSLVREADSSP